MPCRCSPRAPAPRKMPRPPVEVADIIRAAGESFFEDSRKWLTWLHLKVVNAILRCRTAALGGHVDACSNVDTRPSHSTRAETAIARNARLTHAAAGSKRGAKNCCPPATSI